MKFFNYLFNTQKTRLNIFKMDRYTKIKEIGKGSYGVVSLMQDKLDNNRYVVVKTIKVKKKNISELKSAQQEASFLKQLHHPNVIQFFDAFQKSPTEFCIVLEYADAKDLNHYLKTHSNLSEERILRIFSQVILGISYIHSKKIIHRDIKIANIFLFKNGLVKIGDFGISREISEESLASTVIGTPYFMAPEILKAEPYGYPADIWAAGCVLFELMTGDHAFTGITRDDLFDNIKFSETPDTPSRYSRELKSLLVRMLEKDPRSRPTAAEIVSMPLIRNTLKSLEKKIKIDNKKYDPKSPKLQNKSKNGNYNDQGDDSIDQNDVPDWIKDDQKVAAELVRQSVSKFVEDMNMFHDIVSKMPSDIKILPGFSSDLNARRAKIESACREKLGDDNFDKLFKFVKENWSENREQIPAILDMDFYPDDEMKLIDSLMMIDRFLNH